ncbi:hypothetical protein PSHT_14118 [Puccinia striiformis]|uniref:Uncharacterized protein n=1 Tax=Puccinia striiformis TaxID=27350 RepID=A0A2S4ULW3_9BASI|nr:hypothetical protein PSHT_14118 [Puccinia striiformis]
MELVINFDYTLLLLSLLSAILATPTPVKLLWLDLNLPAHENIAGSQSAGTLSNARMETPFEIPTEDRTSNLHHLSVTGARKRQRVDQTTTLPGAKPLLQAESGTFCASIRGNPFEDSVSKGADRFPSNDRKKKKAKTRRLKKYKLKESDLANPGQSFDVYDWSFVQGETQQQSSEDGSIVQSCKFTEFFDMLNTCKGPSPDGESFFWIPRERAHEILGKCHDQARTTGFSFQEELLSKDRRKAALYDTSLSLSNTKINLDQYRFASQDILQDIEIKLQSMLPNTISKIGNAAVKRAMIHVNNVTKVTQFLITIYLSLFKEHHERKLTAEAIESHVDFIRKFWFDIQKGEDNFLAVYPWARLPNQLFHLDESSRWTHKTKFQRSHLHSVACNFFRAWVDEHEKTLNFRSNYPKESLHEMINKILLFSNYESIMSWIESE